MITFKLDQGCECCPVLRTWATMIPSVSALVATSSMKEIGCGIVKALLCSVRVGVGELFRSLQVGGKSFKVF